MAAKKAASSKKPSTSGAKSTSDTDKMMDPGAREVATPEAATNHKRVVGAAKTLISEVLGLFPNVAYEVSNYDGRNAAHDVQFAFDSDDAELGSLLALIEDDERVAEVIEEESQILVSIVMNPRLQDLRDSFGLDDAWDVLTEHVVFEGGSASDTSDDLLDGGSA